MRKILFTSTLLLGTIFSFAQNPSRTTEILKTVTEINNDPSLTTKTLNTEQFLDAKSGQTGQLIGYFKNGKLVKINAKLGLSSCIRNEKFYISNDSLIMF